MTAPRRKIAETPIILPQIARIKCAKNCGWYRDYTKTAGWDDREVVHPLYGPIPERILVRLDMVNHDCIEAANARLRANVRKRNADISSDRMASTG